MAIKLTRVMGGPLLNRYWGRRLTVVCYHRVGPLQRDDRLYRANLSATPAMFAQQLDFLAQYFHIIDLEALQHAMWTGNPLPPRAALITFDDGYIDTYTVAFPLLRARNAPAVVFVVPDFIDQQRLPWWDVCSEAVHRTAKTCAEVPGLGLVDLTTDCQRAGVCDALVQRLKRLEKPAQTEMLRAIQAALEVDVGERAAPVFMSWDHLRELTGHRIACQSHTQSHAILSQIAPEAALCELVSSRQRIEAETQLPVTAVAYPSGTPIDYSAQTIDFSRTAGYHVAFTTSPGPMRYTRIQHDQFAINRICLSHQDTFDTFVLKIMGLPKIKQCFDHA
ncbi:MAG TPA: polysaccharide deacetylase family protein [Herpetosiphonaceae bacterium]|nr:polysaccharide deacetylase family protein [Herpetosiphonaceae bacterium]